MHRHVSTNIAPNLLFSNTLKRGKEGMNPKHLAL
jgi:hypothetical protein